LFAESADGEKPLLFAFFVAWIFGNARTSSLGQQAEALLFAVSAPPLNRRCQGVSPLLQAMTDDGRNCSVVGHGLKRLGNALATPKHARCGGAAYG